MKSAVKIIILTLTVFILTGCGKSSGTKAELSVTGSPGRVLKVNNSKEIKISGNIKLRLNAGNYLLEVSEPGFDTVYKRMILKPGTKTTFSPEMTPIHSSVLIESIPSGAVCEFKGRNVGTTPLVIRDLAPGSYRASLIMPGYAKREISWFIRDSRPLPKIQVSLDSNTSLLNITSTPDQAKIYVDDVPIGYTPFEGNFETGIHSIKLVKAGYIEYSDQIKLGKSQKVRKHYNLRSRPGELSIVTNPAGATITVNGEKRGVSPLKLSLDKGKYSLGFYKDGFDPLEKTITVVPAQTEELLFSLQSATGSARFMVFPGGLSVKLDGKDMKKVPVDGESHKELYFKNLSPGTHILELSHPRAVPSTKRIKFKIKKGVVYQPDEPIEIWIANCEVTYLDGRVEKGALYHETPKGIMFGPSPKIKFEIYHNQLKGFRRLGAE